METKIEVNNMKNEHVIIAALAIALAGTGYYAYTQHQQVQALHEQVDSNDNQVYQSQKKIMDLLATVQDLKNENADLQDRVDSQPAPAAAQSGVSISDIMRQMDEDDLTPKGRDYLDNIRSEKVWKKVKEMIRENAGTMSMDIVKNIAVKVAEEIIFPS